MSVGCAVVVAVLAGSGCSRSGSDGDLAGGETATAEERGWLDEGRWVAPEREVAATDAATAGETRFASAAASAAAGGGPSGPEVTAAPPTQRQIGLSAGSTDDNERWDDYLRYRREFSALGIAVHDIDVSERHVVRVRDRDGTPVLGASVRVSVDGSDRVIADVRTYADGRALFFPAAFGAGDAKTFLISVSAPGSQSTAVEERVPRDRTDHVVTLPARSADLTKLDVMFLLDATGSMGDEIDRLKSHMTAVAERIARRGGGVDARFGLTAYRDGSDAFVTRTFDLTDDVTSFTKALNEVQADGGGDMPEALSAGLRAALDKPAWRDDAVKLIFLVADAPPQMNDPEGADYAIEVRKAAAAGVKIHPIASSGLDDQGEYVYRQLAQITTGRFVFLTYGADGAPGESTPHHVDKYAVLSLDSLVVQLVEDELRRSPGGQ